MKKTSFRFFLPLPIIFALLFAGVLLAPGAAAGLEPAGPIRYPLPTRPAIVVRGACFTAEVSGDGVETAWSAELVSLFDRPALKVKGAAFQKERELWEVELCVPADAREELYDLAVSNSAASAGARRAVKVIPGYKNEYSFVHITDIHIGCCKKYDQFAVERVLEHPSEEIFQRIVSEVNLLNPEFVLITGDVVASAEGQARTLGKIEGTMAEDEFRDFLKILDGFEVPTFVIPGNHDMAGVINKPALEFWEKTFVHRYFSFKYGDAYFLGMDNSNAMEATTFLYPKGYIKLDGAQRKWVDEDLARNSESPLKVFFFHVNTNRKEIDKLAEENGADLALFGHWHEDDVKTGGGTPTTWIQTKAALEKGGYRVIGVKDNRVASHSIDESGASVTWNNLNVEFQPANDGAHASVTAVISNSLPVAFENARLKFIMPDSPGYSAVGGEIVQSVPRGNTRVVYVRADIAPAGRTEVTVTTR